VVYVQKYPRTKAMRPTSFALSLALLSALPSAATAQSVADFYRGKTITCYIGYGVGGGYDLFARTISRHMSRHIPGNPTILPVNMPGASSMVLGNHLAKRAPQDGTAFGAVNSALLFDTLFAGAESKAQFHGPELTMIGNAVSSAAVLVAWHTTGIKTIDDLRSKPLIVGAPSRTGDTYLLPLAMKNTLGLDKLKLITGYPGTREIAIALERGEITGRVWDMEGIKAARPDWLRDNKLNIVAQLAPQKMPEVPAQVPLVKDYVPNDDDKKVLDVIFVSTILARPYIAPPGVPAARIRALRDAFMATMKDPEFLAEIQKLQLNIEPTTGEEMERVVREAYALPQAIVQKVRKALSE
jgi:tripartite-type tricarboxylate transporter receptor subunit TctC